MGSDPQYIKFPDLSLAQHVFNLSNPACPQTLRQSSQKKLQEAITEKKMAPFYRHLAHPVEGILNHSSEGASQPRSSSAVKPLSTLASRRLSQKIDFPWDEALYQSLVEDNRKELAEFQKEEDEAEEAAGDTEVQAARGKRAEFWARVGDKVSTENTHAYLPSLVDVRRTLQAVYLYSLIR
jgi:26S proteasome regulatory subunit N7